MKSLKTRVALFILSLLMHQYAVASDVLPFSVKRVKPVGSGYVELVGPGKIRLDNEVHSYEETKYVKRANIGTMTKATDSDNGCILAYSSEGYTESVSVRDQSCSEILSIFTAIK